MNLFVAIGMDQDAVFCGVRSSQRFVHDVVVVPSRDVRDGFGTDWTDAALRFPEVHQPTFSAQGLLHFDAKAYFQIECPLRVVGVTFPLDLCVPGYWCCRGQAEQVADGFSVLVFCCSEEAPVLVGCV